MVKVGVAYAALPSWTRRGAELERQRCEGDRAAQIVSYRLNSLFWCSLSCEWELWTWGTGVQVMLAICTLCMHFTMHHACAPSLRLVPSNSA